MSLEHGTGPNLYDQFAWMDACMHVDHTSMPILEAWCGILMEAYVICSKAGDQIAAGETKHCFGPERQLQARPIQEVCESCLHLTLVVLQNPKKYSTRFL